MPSALESRLLSEGVAAEQVAVLVVKLAKTRFTTLQSLVGLDDAKLDDALIDVAADRMALLAIRDELLDAANKHSAATDKVAPSEAAPVVAAANDDTSSAAEPAAKRKRAVRPPREKKPLKEPKPPKEPKPAKKRIRLDLIPNREWGLSRTSVDFSTVEQRDEAKAEWSLIRAMPLSAFATPDMDGAKAHFQRMLEAKGFSYKIRDAKGYGWSEHEKYAGKTVTFGHLSDEELAKEAGRAVVELRDSVAEGTTVEQLRALGKPLYEKVKAKERVPHE